MMASPMSASYSPASPIPIQSQSNVLGKALEDDPNPRVPAHTREIQTKLQAPALPSLGQVGSVSVHRRCVSVLSATPPFK